LNDFIKRLKKTGSTTSESGSGRPRTAQTTANIDVVDELVLSQEYEYAFLSQSVVLYCEFVEHPPGSTPSDRMQLHSFAPESRHQCKI